MQACDKDLATTARLRDNGMIDMPDISGPTDGTIG